MTLALAATLLSTATPPTLDPGAGSMLPQLAAAGFGGVAVLIKLYRGRTKDTLRK